jgi:hypothetical protein
MMGLLSVTSVSTSSPQPVRFRLVGLGLGLGRCFHRLVQCQLGGRESTITITIMMYDTTENGKLTLDEELNQYSYSFEPL